MPPRDRRRKGLPDVDALMNAHDAEQAKPDEMITISGAEHIVASARMTDLAATQKAAYRRHAAANGSAAKIAAAAPRVAAAAAEADRIADNCILEMQEINSAGLDSTGHVLGQMPSAWDTGSAVIAALTQRAGAGRPSQERSSLAPTGCTDPEPSPSPGRRCRMKDTITGRTYLERGHPAVVLIRWEPGVGPRNVLIRRRDGSTVVRPFRGLRKPPDIRAEKPGRRA